MDEAGNIITGDIIAETVATGDMVLGVCVRRTGRRRIGTKLQNTELTGLHSTNVKPKSRIGRTRLDLSQQC
jgi:hypothetical protein